MRISAFVALAGVLGLTACGPMIGGSSSAIAFGLPRTDEAAADRQGQEALAEAVESVNQLLDSGRAAYLADPAKRSALDYCRSGEATIERGELRAAVRDKSMALFAATQIRDPLLSAECARSIAVAYSFAGLHRRAIDWTDEAERYLQQAGPGADASRVAGVKGPLLKIRADAALGRGDRIQARAFLQAARSVAPDYYQPYILVSLAQIDLAQGAIAAAGADLDAANDLPGVPDELNAIIVRTKAEVALAGNDQPGAAALFTYGAKLSAQSGDSYGLAWAERGLAKVEQAQGHPAQAANAYGRAVQAAEQSRAVFRAEELRSGSFGTLQVIFDEAVDILARQGQWQAAFDMSERGRARSLRELLRGEANPGADPIASAADVAVMLPDGTALVSYHALPDRLLVWTVRRSGLRGVSVALPAKDLESQVRRFTRLIDRPGQDAALIPVAQSLYASLIQPAGLNGQEQIIFVPFGILHNLAFAALRNGSRWLIEDHAISEVLAAGSVVNARSSAFPVGQDIKIFADPDGSLPAADQEAAAIAKIIPGATVFSGAEASKARFIADGTRARVLHVAAHAVFDPLDPLASRIRLAGRSQVAGELQAREVYSLSLASVDTLVLSACETSIGFPSPGDEVIGLNRSFLSAGVRNLVSTLWSISDQATALLMALFYRNLSTGTPSALMPEALRSAQLELLHLPATASPYYWAAFTLTRSPGRAGR